MTPKREAKRLYKKFLPHAKWWDGYNDIPLEENHAKKCATITCNELIKATKSVYWEQVKSEIKKL